MGLSGEPSNQNLAMGSDSRPAATTPSISLETATSIVTCASVSGVHCIGMRRGEGEVAIVIFRIQGEYSITRVGGLCLQ